MSKAPSESWVPIPGFTGEYEISNQGRVRSLAREIKIVQIVKIRARVLKTRWAAKGVRKRTRCVTLRQADGEKRQLSIPRLMLEAFIGPPPTPTTRVKRKDPARGDVLDNLTW